MARARSVGTGRQISAIWWAALSCGALVVMSPATLLLLLALLSPTLLVALLPDEHGDGRPVKAALLFGLAGSMQPVHRFWMAGADLSLALDMLRAPITLATAWIGILGGWLTGEVATLVLRLAAELNAGRSRRRMMAEIAALEAEWGPLPPVHEADRPA